jgi:hypothetical protein
VRSLAKDKFYQAAEPRKPRLRAPDSLCLLVLAGPRKRPTMTANSLRAELGYDREGFLVPGP